MLTDTPQVTRIVRVTLKEQLIAVNQSVAIAEKIFDEHSATSLERREIDTRAR